MEILGGFALTGKIEFLPYVKVLNANPPNVGLFIYPTFIYPTFSLPPPPFPLSSLHTAWEEQMAALEAEAAELHAEVGALRNLLNEKNAQVILHGQ